MIKHTLKKKNTLPTHVQPVDENAAEHLADQLEASGDPAPAETALVPAPRVAAPARLSTPKDYGFIGDFDLTDVPIPQLKIVQGAGKMSEKFNIGSVVYNDDVLFHSHEAPLNKPLFRFIVASYHKQFRETLPKSEADAGLMPRTVSTKEEALSLGGGFEWGRNGERPRWSPSAKLILIMEAPEGSDNPNFFIELEGKRYAPAVVYAANTAYKHFATDIFARSMMANRPLETLWWSFSVGKTKSGQHSVFVPNAKMVVDVVPAAVQELAQKFRGTVQVGDQD